MRKVLSLVLVLALVLSSFSMAFADDTAAATTATTTASTALSDVEGLACEQAVKVLVDLGVVTGYADGTYKPAATVTRAEAAVIVIKMLGLEKSVGSQKSSYTDMAGYGWAEPYIAFASNLGILQGDGNGKYRPGDPVSYNEFAKIMVAALGYTADSLTGTWPGNYVNKAAGLGIMDDIVSGGAAPATRGDVAIMVNNNLTNEVGTIDKDGVFQPTPLAAGGNDTVINRLGGTKVVGVVNAVDDAVINAKEYLGKYCEYYVNSDNEIIAVKEVKSTTISGDYTADGKLEGDDDVDYTLPTVASTAWTYTDDTGATVNHVIFANGVSTVTNNVPAAVAAPAPAAPYITLEVKLSGKIVKEVYSEMTWTEDACAKVKAGDVAEIKDDKSLLGFDFTTNKDGSIKTNSFELVGVKSLDDIKTDDIVYVYADAANKEIVKVVVGTETVEGKVTKVNGTDEWKVNGTTYTFAFAAGGNGADAYANKLDSEVKLFLDGFGKIYKYEVTAGSADNYAVVTRANPTTGQVKLYMADETEKLYDVKSGTTDAVAAADVSMVVAYSIDKDGEVDDYINSRAVVVSDAYFENDKLLVVLTGAGIAPAGKYKVDGDVTVFLTSDPTITPGALAGPSDLSVGKVSDLEKGATDGTAKMALYLEAGTNKVLAVLVPDSVNAGTSTDSYAVISAVDAATNGVGDKAQELTGYIDGKKMKEVFTSGQTVAPAVATSLAGINLYKIKYNADNNISKLTAVGNTPVTNQYGSTDLPFQYVSDGYLTLGAAGAAAAAGTTYAVNPNAQVYKVTFKSNGDIDEYATFGGTIKAGDQVWMFNYDDDDSEYDCVIVKQN